MPARKRCAAISISRRSAASRASRRIRSTRCCRIRPGISGSARKRACSVMTAMHSARSRRPATMRRQRAKRQCPRSSRTRTARSGSAPAAPAWSGSMQRRGTIDRVPTRGRRAARHRQRARARARSGSRRLGRYRCRARARRRDGRSTRIVACVAARRRPASRACASCVAAKTARCGSRARSACSGCPRKATRSSASAPKCSTMSRRCSIDHAHRLYAGSYDGLYLVEAQRGAARLAGAGHACGHARSPRMRADGSGSRCRTKGSSRSMPSTARKSGCVPSAICPARCPAR